MSGLYETERMTTEALLKNWNEVYRFDFLSGIEKRLIPWFSDKNDHGDMDILLAKEEISKDAVIDALESMENVLDVRENGNTVSANILLFEKQFQADFIIVGKADYDFTRLLKSFGGVGIHLGRYARKGGFKLKDDGLYHGETGILVSKSLPDIFSLFGFDLSVLDTLNKAVNHFDMSYDSKFNEDMLVELIASSIYFNKNLFSISDFNGKHKRRAKKRKSIVSFSNKITKYPEGVWSCIFDSRHFCEEAMLFQAERKFFEFKEEYLLYKRKEEEREKAKSVKKEIVNALKEYFKDEKVFQAKMMEFGKTGFLKIWTEKAMSKGISGKTVIDEIFGKQNKEKSSPFGH